MKRKMVSQDWFTQAVVDINSCLDDALWCLEQIKQIEAAEALFKFKRNSSYWPEYCLTPQRYKSIYNV